MADQRADVLERIEAWDREAYAAEREEAEQQRQAILERFPLEDWPTLDVERYALGTPGPHSFCWYLEFGSPKLGSIAGGNAMKHLIFRRQSGEWYFASDFSTLDEAWRAVREQLVRAFDLAGHDFEGISALPLLQNGSRSVAKAISVYRPDSLMPVFARGHRDHFLRLVGVEEDGGEYAWRGCRRLLEVYRQRIPQLDAWSPLEIMHFLYREFSPIDTTAIVKVAPGPDANLWPDCLEHGYIRIGWDEVGDLSEYASREEFGAAFSTHFAEKYYKGNKAKTTEKAGEVWRFFELAPGDTVVANKGTSRIVGIGTVTDAGYSYRPELEQYGQTVAVDWHDLTERDIDPIKRWAFKTVAKVSQADYKRILAGRSDEPTSAEDKPKIPTLAPDPLLGEIERALVRKGQLILYGPPGTGKTYNARRFTVWWLGKRRGESDASGVLADDERFLRLEESLSTATTDRRVWWVVANPSQWDWETLFTEGTVEYRYGRLQRNYALVEPGELVIGYQSTPDKRVVALARVREGLHTGPEGPAITLEPVTRVANGPNYAELTMDAELKNSEPMRFRNQGTLFGLTSAEADYVLAWLRERDPSLESLTDEAGDAIGPLTRVTFHPSYAYEDFVEGYKPQSTGTGQLDLRLTDGVFKTVCRAAAADPEHDYVMLIDEINRGNIPKIFGELITLLERDKRDVSVVLPQSRESFSVPPNVYIVGTMNTADRSIRLLDAALRRRFAFIELMPDSGPLEGGEVGKLDLAVFLSELNRRITRQEGREKQIGHSFLLDEGQPVDDPGRFAQQFRHEILPLLQEYAYDDYRELAEYVGSSLVDVEEQRVRAEVLGDADALIHALATHLMPQEAAVPAVAEAPSETAPSDE